MEKKNNKKLLWVLLIVGIVVLAAAATLLFVLPGMGGSGDGPQTDVAAAEKLYWNVDRYDYVAKGMNGTSGRNMRSDGYFHITFAVDGGKVDLLVVDDKLVDYIEMQDVMGLVFDENGVVVDIKTVEECGYTYISRQLYVKTVDGDNFVGNNAGNLKGIDVPFSVTEETEIYDIGSDGPLAGLACGIDIDDEVVVIGDQDGNVKYVYVRPYTEPGDLYWNTERMYNSTTGQTTRPTDLLGYYSYEFAFNGELITLRTKDANVASAIDKQNAPVMTLQFDEDGFITAKTSYTVATKGGTWGSWCDVTAINGKTVTVKRILSGSNQGTVYEADMSEFCKIMDVSGQGEYKGIYSELRVGDRVHCCTDARGRLCYIYIVSRKFDGQIAWNFKKEYDSTNKVTTRVPDADGYYRIKMAVGGEERVLKTRNKALVDKIDSFVCYGVKLDGDEILKVAAANAVHGGNVFGSYYYVTELGDNGYIKTERVVDGVNKVQEGYMDSEAVIYDVSTNATKWGSQRDKLKIGDRIHAFMDNLTGKIVEIYVVETSVDVPIYWNISRKYNSTTKQTTRERAEDGYYYFEMAANGKEVTVRTKDKEIATKIDSNAAKQVGLSVAKDGTILKVYGTSSVNGCQGGSKSLSWVDVTKISGRTITAKKNQSGHKDDGKIFTTTMTSNCKVYNVDSDGYLKNIGELTNVRVGDKIHVHHNLDGKATIIFVVDGRTAPLDTDPKECPCAQDVTWEPWDGTTELVSGKYYYLTADVTAPAEGWLLEGKTVNLRLDGHTISSTGRIFYIQSGGQLNICDHETRGKLIGSGVKGESGGVIRVYTNSGKAQVNLWNIDVMSDGDNTTAASEGGLMSVSGPVTAHNVNFIGGYTTSRGGNIHVNPSGTFRAFDCTITGGNTKGSGGNISNIGRVYLENTTVTDGVATSSGDNMSMSSSLENRVKDTTFGGNVAKSVYISKGVLDVEGNLSITGASKYNLKLTGDATLNDAGIAETSVIGLSRDGEGSVLTGVSKDLSGLFVIEDCEDLEMLYDAKAKKVWMKSTLVAVEHTGDHCLCVGNEEMSDLAGHTCSVVTGWKTLDSSVLTTSTVSSSRLMFKESGNYYLNVKQNFGKIIDVIAGQEITICLNGADLKNAGIVFYVSGKLNITDCRGTGRVIGAETSNGGAIKIVSGGNLNLYGGTLTAESTVTQGGGVIVVSTDKASHPVESDLHTVFNMYGGTVTGGNSTVDGGNITIWHKTTEFNMYGGTISNGTSATSGGNISAKASASTAKVNLLGGTITGGTAPAGAGINIGNCTVTIGDKIEFVDNNGADITLDGGKVLNIHDSGLKNVESIKLEASVGVVVANIQADQVDIFQVDDKFTKVYDEENKTLALAGKAHEAHCICAGATLSPLVTHTCTDLTGWTAITEAVFTRAIGADGKDKGLAFIESGNYYLASDYALSSLLNILPGQEITICLNGFTLSRSGNVVVVAGVLNITDCTDEGGIAASTTNYGGAVKPIKGGVVNQYGGTLTNSQSPKTAGGGVVAVTTDGGNGLLASSVTGGSTYNMYGGAISGGTTGTSSSGAGQPGGNVAVFHSGCTFNMYGGTVSGGTAAGNGGNISVAVGAVNLLGGTITGGTAQGGLGNDVVCYNVGVLTIGGDVTIGEVGLNGKTIKIHDSGLTTTTPIKIVADEGTFATNVQTDLSACFDHDTLNVLFDSYNKTLILSTETEPPAPPQDIHTHCTCGGYEDHTCADVNWTAWDGDAGVLTDGGYYYLTDDVTVTAAGGITISGKKVTICLNDHTISSTAGRAFNITANGELVLCGHEGGKTDTVQTAGYSGQYGSVIRLGETSSKLTAYGVDLKRTDNGSVTGSEGGVISTKGAVLLKNVNVSGGKAQRGGNISAFGGSLTMYDCTVTGGVATDGIGGNIIAQCATTLVRCTVTDGSAAAEGDNICVNASTTTLEDCTITNAKTGEGSVYLKAGALKLVGENIITGDAYGVYLPGGKTIDVSAATDGTSVGVTMEAEGIFATGATTDLSGCFYDDKDVAQVTYDAAAQTLALGEPAAHTHCYCTEDTKALIADHTCTEVEWIPVTTEVFETTNGTASSVQGYKFIEDGYYYLTGDYASDKKILILPGQTIYLDLNGYELSFSGQGIFVAGTFNLTDCQGDGAITASTVNYGGTIKPVKGGLVNQFGGTLTNTKATTNAGGGVVAVTTDSGNIATATTGSTYNMYGGAIVDGATTKKSDGTLLTGGNVAIFHANCFFNMYGGTISGGTADGEGGNISVGNGTFNLLGGTITGGESKVGKGDDIRFIKGSLTIGGDVQIGQIYVASGYTMNLQNLNTAKKIRIITDGAYAFANGTEADAKFFVAAASNEFHVEYADGKLIIAEGGTAHKHCVCGGAAVGVGDHTTCTELTWDAWGDEESEKTTLPSTSGNYYLVSDVTLSAQFKSLPTDGTVSLCLNGYEITGTNRLIGVGGTLNVTDCCYDAENDIFEGGIIGSVNSKNGLVFYTYGGSTLNIYGGRFEATGTTGTTNSGGVLAISKEAYKTGGTTTPSVVNLYNGFLAGGKYKSGGTVCVMNGATFNMYGGIVTGGEAVQMGGNITVGSNCTTKILGGWVHGAAGSGMMGDICDNGNLTIGGEAVISGEVYVAAGKTLKLEGEPLIGSVTLAGHTDTAAAGTIALEKGDLGFGTVIYVDVLDATDAFATVTDPAQKNFFEALDETCSVVCEDNKLYVKKGHWHCVCEGAEAVPETHTCQNLEWTALTQAMFDNPDGVTVTKGTSYTLAEGKAYYLAEDIKLNASLDVAINKEVTLCLNGKSLHVEGKQLAYFQGTLNITDCDYMDAKINDELYRVYAGEISTTYTSYGAVMYPRGGSTLNFYGGNIKGNTITGNGGGAIMNGGNFNMYGGKIYGGTAKTNGGNVCVVDDGIMTMYGGTITGGTAGGAGGNIYSSANETKKLWSQLYIYGGRITDGTAATTGGNIHTYAGVSFVLENATVSGGTCGDDGGNLRIGDIAYQGGTVVETTVFSMKNATVINGKAGTASGNLGGNIYFDGTTNSARVYNIENSTIGYTEDWNADTKTAYQGGNIYFNKGGYKLTDCTVNGGYVAHEGGSMRISKNVVVALDGTTVTGGRASDCGGNVQLYGKLELLGGSLITEGVCNGRGGNVSMYASDATYPCTLIVNGSSITNGQGNYAGNIRISGDEKEAGAPKVTLINATVSGGTATTSNPSIQLDGVGTLTLGGTLLVDNVNITNLTAVMQESTEVALTETSSVGISANTDGKFMTVSGTIDYLKVFVATASGKSVTKDGNDLSIG